MRRTLIAVLATLTVATALSATPASSATPAQTSARGAGLENCTATACHFDVAPGTYDVRVLLGGDAEASTGITGETRRTLLPETATAAGERVARSFTVNVRTPEGEPTGPAGTPASTSSSAARHPRSPTSASPPRGTPARSSSSATPPPATSPATRTPAGASSCPSTSVRASRSPTTRIPGRVRSATSTTPRSSRPSSR